jgi:hypothetical protein
VIDALADHAVVALGESHDLDEAGRFYDALVRSDDFARVADAVVVEFGNARFQDVADRYVSGADVPSASVRRIWQDTTQVGAWDAPMYERFFRSVRDANAGRPPGDRLRVLLGDPPIDWSTVAGEGDVKPLLATRERFMARQVEREILDRGRHAVVIAGLAHVERPTGATQRPNVSQQLDEAEPGSTYVVGVHLGFPSEEWEQRLASWPVPSIVALRGTWIGDLPKGVGTAQDALDAMLYFGPPEGLHLSIPLPTVYVQPGYWEELRRRWELEGFGPFSAEALFQPYSQAVYPGAFTAQGLADARSFALCMRAHGVEEFPDPQFQYDAFGFYGSAVEPAREDPDFTSAERACFAAQGEGAP